MASEQTYLNRGDFGVPLQEQLQSILPKASQDMKTTSAVYKGCANETPHGELLWCVVLKFMFVAWLSVNHQYLIYTTQLCQQCIIVTNQICRAVIYPIKNWKHSGVWWINAGDGVDPKNSLHWWVHPLHQYMRSCERNRNNTSQCHQWFYSYNSWHELKTSYDNVWCNS